MTTAPPSPKVAGLRAGILLTALVGAVAATIAALTGGAAEVTGALVGTVLVGGFFVLGALGTSLAAAYAPATSLLVALLTYTLQVVLLGLVYLGLSRSGVLGDSVDGGWLGAVVIAGTLCWMGTLVLAATRARIPVYELGGPAASGPAEEQSVEQSVGQVGGQVGAEDNVTVSPEVRG